MPGSHPGERRGGRQKGTPNKRTLLLAERSSNRRALAEANGIMPLDVMLEHMRQRYVAGDMPTAHMAARDCAPYLHPRLSAAEVKVQQKPSDQDEEESKRLAIEAFVAAFGPRKLTVNNQPAEAVNTEHVLTDETNVDAEPEHIENSTDAAE